MKQQIGRRSSAVPGGEWVSFKGEKIVKVLTCGCKRIRKTKAAVAYINSVGTIGVHSNTVDVIRTKEAMAANLAKSQLKYCLYKANW